MKKFTAVFSLILLQCCLGHSIGWNDLEVEKSYSLNAQINFEKFSLYKNEIWKLVAIDSESNNFIRFQMQPLNCDQENLESELVIYEAVGVKYDSNCNLNMYIEPYQYYDESFF